MDVYRPGGVQALAIFFIIISVLGFIFGIQVAATFNSELNITILYYTLLIPILQTYGPLNPLYNYILFGSVLLEISDLNIRPPMAIILLIASGLYLITSIGLLYMKRWGRKLGLIIGILNIVGGIFSLIFIPTWFFILGIIILIFGIITIWYLTTDVKYDFE